MSDTICISCTNLTIDHLVDLAHEEFEQDDQVPEKACYQLHESINALEHSAELGCSFCSLLLTSLKGYEDNGNWIADLWKGEDCVPEFSLYDSAKQLPYSDVKMCIASGNSDRDEKLVDVKVLDRLLVQIGPYWGRGNTEPDEDYDKDVPEFPVLRFALECPRENPVYVGRFRIGRYDTESALESNDNFNIARDWLQDCQTTHQHCLMGVSPELPTRVIDVGLREDWKDLCVTHTKGEKAAYIALSHCWGGPISPLLTSGTLQRFQTLLPFRELPPNFQDAITITRHLAIRYLWIDSLCIVQDSRQDWAKESKKMGQIYRNATVTVSALASAGSKHGIFPRDFKAELPIPTLVTLRVSQSDERRVTVSREDFNEETLQLLDHESPLSGRGWCLQEAILSPRQLYYGESQLYWRCPAGYEAADGTSAGMKIPEHPLPYLSAFIFRDILRSRPTESPDPRPLLEDYYTLVEMYSQRNLTYGTDKLPAFSGIAARLHTMVNGTYLAGVWSVDIMGALLWYREMRTCNHVKPYRAPTWSWAVTDDPVQFYNKGATLVPSSSSIVLLANHVTLCDPTNPFGEVSSASIVVSGLTLPLVRSKQRIGDAVKQYYTATTSWDETPPRYEQEEPEPDASPAMFLVENDEGLYLLTLPSSDFTRRNDDFELDVQAYTPEEYIALLVYVAEHEKEELEVSDPAQGLILKPVSGPGGGEDRRYERIGIFRFRQLKGLQLGGWNSRVLELV